MSEVDGVLEPEEQPRPPFFRRADWAVLTVFLVALACAVGFAAYALATQDDRSRRAAERGLQECESATRVGACDFTR